jgi:rhodanese-related sulfurtransferase
MSHDAAYLQRVAEARARIPATPVAQLAAQQGAGAVLLDVREAADYAAGHVAGARHISLATLAASIASVIPDQNAAVICYCNGGTRGVMGADTLRALGYANVSVLDGGYRAYQQQGESP